MPNIFYFATEADLVLRPASRAAREPGGHPPVKKLEKRERRLAGRTDRSQPVCRLGMHRCIQLAQAVLDRELSWEEKPFP